jgi:hypothetical protein
MRVHLSSRRQEQPPPVTATIVMMMAHGAARDLARPGSLAIQPVAR